jgi:hypothetical protein
VAAAVLSSGIPSTQPDLAAHYAYVRKIWPELYLSFLLLTGAFLSLIPLAVVLRQRFGGGLRAELLYASFLGASILGVLWMLTQIGSAQVVARDTAGANPQTLAAIGSASSIWSGVINWLQRGFLLFAGLGSYWTGRAILDLGLLPRRLGWLSLILASFYGLGLLSLLMRDAGLPVPDAAGSILIILGSLVATVWAIWLGWELGRRVARDQ